VLLMSARADAELGRAAVAEGALGMLPKPVAIARLSTFIHQHFP
jgi:response regulator of citrate/malate metabolism